LLELDFDAKIVDLAFEKSPNKDLESLLEWIM